MYAAAAFYLRVGNLPLVYWTLHCAEAISNKYMFSTVLVGAVGALNANFFLGYYVFSGGGGEA